MAVGCELSVGLGGALPNRSLTSITFALDTQKLGKARVLSITWT